MIIMKIKKIEMIIMKNSKKIIKKIEMIIMKNSKKIIKKNSKRC